MLLSSKYCFYRPQRSCGQGNVFTGVCLSTGGGVSASVHAGMPDPPGTRQETPPPSPLPRDLAETPLGPDPPGPGRHPPDQADTPQTRQTPPRPGRHPPPDQAHPPGKQTPAYGLRAAGTHPTGMHSSFSKYFRTAPWHLKICKWCHR